MPAQELQVPNLPVANSFSANDHLVAVVSGNTSLLSISGVLSIPITNVTPANSSATTITAPAPAWTDGTYLYLVTANNVVKRVTLSNF